MIQSWLVLSLIALLIWGGWGVFANLTAKHLSGYNALIWEVAGAMVAGGVVLTWLLRNGGLDTTVRGASFGLATGITYTSGLLFLFLAMNRASQGVSSGESSGSVNTILVLTALYPVIAVALNYLFLGEPFSLRQVVGMCIGLTGIAILMTS